eukprot:Opistho-2@36052
MSDEGDSVGVGISLGGTYASVAVCRGKAVDVVCSEDGDRVTPAHVAYVSGHEPVIGNAAKNELVRNPVNTVYGARSILGRPFDDPAVQALKKQLAATIVEHEGSAAYEVDDDSGSRKIRTASEVTTLLVRRMKEIAEQNVGSPVTSAVLTAPINYGPQQRAELKKAAEAAGIKVLRIISEPTAAVLAHMPDIGRGDSKNVVVFDLGASSLEVTVLAVRGGVIRILSTLSEPSIGGSAFDERLVNHFAQEFKRNHKNDISTNKRALAKLRVACETAKRTLSSSAVAHCSIESLAEGVDFNSNVNRSRFDMMAGEIFRQLADPIDKALAAASLTADDITDVILAGGASKIPKVKTIVADRLPKAEIGSRIQPDEYFSIGAAYEAGLLVETDEPEENEAINTAPCVSADILVQVDGGEFVTMIGAHTPVPAKAERLFSVPEGAEGVVIRVYEAQGDSKKHIVDLALKHAHHHAAVPKDKKDKKDDGKPALQGDVVVHCDVSKEGHFRVSATERKTGAHARAVAKGHHGHSAGGH